MTSSNFKARFWFAAFLLFSVGMVGCGSNNMTGSYTGSVTWSQANVSGSTPTTTTVQLTDSNNTLSGTASFTGVTSTTSGPSITNSSTGTFIGTTSNGVAQISSFTDSTYCPTAGTGSLTLSTSNNSLTGTITCSNYTISFTGMTKSQ